MLRASDIDAAIFRIPFNMTGLTEDQERALTALAPLSISIKSDKNGMFIEIPKNEYISVNKENPYPDMFNYSVTFMSREIITVAVKTNLLKKYDGHVIVFIAEKDIFSGLRNLQSELELQKELAAHNVAVSLLTDNQHLLYKRFRELQDILVILAHNKDFGLFSDNGDKPILDKASKCTNEIYQLRDKCPAEYNAFINHPEFSHYIKILKNIENKLNYPLIGDLQKAYRIVFNNF